MHSPQALELGFVIRESSSGGGRGSYFDYTFAITNPSSSSITMTAGSSRAISASLSPSVSGCTVNYMEYDEDVVLVDEDDGIIYAQNVTTASTTTIVATTSYNGFEYSDAITITVTPASSGGGGGGSYSISPGQTPTDPTLPTGVNITSNLSMDFYNRYMINSYISYPEPRKLKGLHISQVFELGFVMRESSGGGGGNAVRLSAMSFADMLLTVIASACTRYHEPLFHLRVAIQYEKLRAIKALVTVCNWIATRTIVCSSCAFVHALAMTVKVKNNYHE